MKTVFSTWTFWSTDTINVTLLNFMKSFKIYSYINYICDKVQMYIMTRLTEIIKELFANFLSFTFLMHLKVSSFKVFVYLYRKKEKKSEVNFFNVDILAHRYHLQVRVRS